MTRAAAGPTTRAPARGVRPEKPGSRGGNVRNRDDMANIKSAKKRIRQEAKRTDANRTRMSRVRTYVRKVEDAISGGDKKAAEAALHDAMPEMQRGVTKGVLHKNTASRKLSRLAKRVKAL